METIPVQFLGQGLLGVILWWFMIRLETIIKQNTDSVNRMNRVISMNSKTMILMAEAINHRNNHQAGAFIDKTVKTLSDEIDEELNSARP